MQLTRRGFLKLAGVAAAEVGLTAVFTYTYGIKIEPERPVVEQLEIPIRHLPPSLEGFVIVQLSDFHLHPFTQIELVKEVVATTNTLEPDVIFLTGDYVLETADSIFELAPVLATLNAMYGIFTVLGNHDYWTNADVVREGLRESGLPVLHNENVSIGVGKANLALAGVDDSCSGKPDFEAALSGLPTGDPLILLAHEPDFADAYLADGRVTLQLSGHSHGGQVRLPGGWPMVLPPYGQKYHNGLYKVHESWVYTSRGIGVISPPIRMNCSPEITQITLVSA